MDEIRKGDVIEPKEGMVILDLFDLDNGKKFYMERTITPALASYYNLPKLGSDGKMYKILFYIDEVKDGKLVVLKRFVEVDEGN